MSKILKPYNSKNCLIAQNENNSVWSATVVPKQSDAYLIHDWLLVVSKCAVMKSDNQGKGLYLLAIFCYLIFILF